MLDGIAVILMMLGFYCMFSAYIKCRKENEILREKLDISVMKEQLRKKVLMEKIEGMELPFLARDNTNLKTGFDVAKNKAIKLVKEEHDV